MYIVYSIHCFATFASYSLCIFGDIKSPSLEITMRTCSPLLARRRRAVVGTGLRTCLSALDFRLAAAYGQPLTKSACSALARAGYPDVNLDGRAVTFRCSLFAGRTSWCLPDQLLLIVHNMCMKFFDECERDTRLSCNSSGTGSPSCSTR